MHWRKPINIDRGLATVVPMGVLLAWIAAIGPMWCHDVMGGHWPGFSTFHLVVMYTSGVLGVLVGVATVPAVIPCLMCRPYGAATAMIYTPTAIVAFVVGIAGDSQRMSLLAIIGLTVATLLISCAVAWFALPAARQEQSSPF